MEPLNASKFKEQCVSLLDHLDPDGIVITKHGKRVARLIPIESDCAELSGSVKGKVQVKGDIVSPGIKWNAATSVVHRVPLVTRDRGIRRSKIVPLARA